MEVSYDHTTYNRRLDISLWLDSAITLGDSSEKERRGVNMMSEKEMTNEELTAKALCHALKAFEDYLVDNYYDPAFWDIRLTAWLKDSANLKRYKKFEIESEIEGGE